jgi:ATP-binding cassette subfamily F protein 3
MENLSELERKAPAGDTATAGDESKLSGKEDSKLSYQQMKELEREKSKLKKKIQQCEARIEELEGIIAQLEDELGNVTDSGKILELTAKYESAKNELDLKMEEWAELSE